MTPNVAIIGPTRHESRRTLMAMAALQNISLVFIDTPTTPALSKMTFELKKFDCESQEFVKQSCNQPFWKGLKKYRKNRGAGK